MFESPEYPTPYLHFKVHMIEGHTCTQLISRWNLIKPHFIPLQHPQPFTKTSRMLLIAGNSRHHQEIAFPWCACVWQYKLTPSIKDIFLSPTFYSSQPWIKDLWHFYHTPELRTPELRTLLSFDPLVVVAHFARNYQWSVYTIWKDKYNTQRKTCTNCKQLQRKENFPEFNSNNIPVQLTE